MGDVKSDLGNQKILWAVDAFSDSPDVQAQAARAVRMLLKDLSASIEPVYVAPPEPLGVPRDAIPDLDLSWTSSARRNLEWLLKLVPLAQLTPPRILSSEGPSIGSLIKTLIAYAQREKFHLIVVGTHGRKGVPRLFLGSFAERLILESPIPVLVASAKAEVGIGKRVKHILFPTDFSDGSREVFERVVTMAKYLKSDLLLFHQLETIYPLVAYPFIVPPVSPESLDDFRRARRELGEKWIEWAKTQSVKAKFHLATSSAGAAGSIVRAARRLPNCLIAMASHVNRTENVLLGSVTRQVVRSATSPVYVMHPGKPGPAEPSSVRRKNAVPGRALLS